MRRQFGFTALEVVVVLIIVFGACGWIWNIVKIVGSTFDPLTAIVVLRCVGVVVFPVGAVLGFL